jgi:uncharacterized protein YjdB
MKFTQSIFTASLFLALAAGAGCTGSTAPGGGNNNGNDGVTDDGKVIAGIEITPDKTTLSKGETQQFRAVARYADGTTEDITDSDDVVWNTNEPTVATVSRKGLVTAEKAGVVNITVKYKGETGEEHFAVMP